MRCRCRLFHEDRRERIASRIADALLYASAEAQVEQAVAERIWEAISEKKPRRSPNFSAYYAFLDPYERSMIRWMSRYWKDQAKTILSNMRRSRLPDDRTDAQAFNRLFEQWMFADAPANKMLAALYSEWAGKLIRAYGPIVAREWEIMMRAADGDEKEKSDKYSVGGEWSLYNQRIDAWLNSYKFKFSKRLNKVSTKLLKKELLEGFHAGETMADLSKRVNKTYAGWTKFRSDLIAKTETIRASNHGALEVYRASGIVEKTMWIATPDEMLCETCRWMDGKVTGLDSDYDFAFTINGEKHEVMTECPPAHPRCRCTLVPIYETDRLIPDGRGGYTID